MANHPPNTPSGVTEPTYFFHSPISSPFSRLVVAIGGAIEAERDIEHGLWSDPSFSGLLLHAELSWKTVKASCHAVLDAPRTRLSDVPPQKMARHLHVILTCETVVDLRCAQSILRTHAELFSWHGEDPISIRASQMLARARQQFQEICDLNMMPGDPEPENVPDTDQDPALPDMIAAE